MSQEYVKKAFAEATKDQQQQEIDKIKKIVLAHLEKIESLSTDRKKLDEQIKVHKAILDDLKAGRLDKIEEYIEKDEKAKQHTLIIVKRVEKEYIPMQPWRSPWYIDWNGYPFYQTISVTAGTSQVTANTSAYLHSTGTSISTFTGGTYTTSGGNSITL